MAHYGVVLVTAGSEAEATTIAQHLVENNLAGCASIAPVRSIYRWQGQIETAQEWQLTIETDLDRFDDLARAVKSRHTYRVPKIIALPIVKGDDPYLYWLETVVEPTPAVIGAGFQASTTPTQFTLTDDQGTVYCFPSAGMAIDQISPDMARQTIAYIRHWQASQDGQHLPQSFQATWQEAIDYFAAIPGIETGTHH